MTSIVVFYDDGNGETCWEQRSAKTKITPSPIRTTRGAKVIEWCFANGDFAFPPMWFRSMITHFSRQYYFAIDSEATTRRTLTLGICCSLTTWCDCPVNLFVIKSPITTSRSDKLMWSQKAGNCTEMCASHLVALQTAANKWDVLRLSGRFGELRVNYLTMLTFAIASSCLFPDTFDLTMQSFPP